MTNTSKLQLLRDFHNKTIQEIAKKMSLTVSNYKDLESGKSIVNQFIAQKFSIVYNVPKEFFMTEHPLNNLHAEVIYTNCSFNGNGSNGYINHQYNDRGLDEVLSIKNQEIQALKSRVNELMVENMLLLSRSI